jgi:hypothetical protein
MTQPFLNDVRVLALAFRIMPNEIYILRIARFGLRSKIESGLYWHVHPMLEQTLILSSW